MGNNKENTEAVEKSTADSYFKFYIHKSYVLSRILKDNLDELKNLSLSEVEKCLNIGKDGVTVIGRETEYITKDGKKAYLDSVFDVRIPGRNEDISVIVGLEGQNDPNPGYPIGKRAGYYLSRMISAQKGREFDDDYGDIRKTYSIWCILDPKADDRNTIVRYKMKGDRVYGDSQHEPDELDMFNIIMVNIGKYNDDLPDALAIGTAMFSLMEKDARRELMNKRFNISLTDEDLEKLNDMTHLTQDKYNHGFREGRAEGKAEGIAEERAVSTEIIVSGIVSMVLNGTPLEEAVSMFTFPDDRLSEIEAEVRRRLDRS